MKTAWLLHGTGGSSEDYYWFEDTKAYLESNGYEVWWPALPNTESPELEETRSFVEENMPTLDAETIIIGHSSACPLMLNLLEDFEEQVKQVFLVGGYYIKINPLANKMLPRNFDWDAIKKGSQEFIFINSDNDPWGCTDEQARNAARALSSPLVVNFGEGHMGSSSYEQPYREFDLLKRLLKV